MGIIRVEHGCMSIREHACLINQASPLCHQYVMVTLIWGSLTVYFAQHRCSEASQCQVVGDQALCVMFFHFFLLQWFFLFVAQKNGGVLNFHLKVQMLSVKLFWST
jgi:hypothetical protein